MKTFCPNCGTQNEGLPGGRVTCSACTASFEVPRGEAGSTPPPAVVAEPPPPLRQTFPSSQVPQGYVGPPPTGFSRGAGGDSSAPVNTLAVVSLVLGLLCCIPFASIGALVTGAIAQNQIAAANGAQRGREFALVGMILGGLGVVTGILGLVASFLGKLH